jgi:flagellar motility protein MotE (MotC chaperone)
VARRGGWRPWAAGLLVTALLVGADIATTELARAEGDKHEAKAEVKAGEPVKKTPTVVTVGPPSKDEKKQDEKKQEEKDSKEAGKPQGKAEAKTEGKTDAKTEAKGEAKTEAKTDAKAEAKADTKKDAKTDAKKDDKTPASATAAKGAKGNKSAAAEDGPAPPSTPPIKMAALRDEMSRPPRKEEHTGASRGEREKLEHLAAEINKAREALRQDTARLEAMLAARDAAAQAAPPSTAPAAGGEGGETPKKVPTPLDNLAKAIRGMKPEQAAPIISRVDRKLAADVLLRMPGADAGKVLGVCKPDVAAELAAEIASRTPRAELRR